MNVVGRQSGSSLIETIIAMTLLSVIIVGLFAGLSLTAHSDFLVRVSSKARSVAVSQLEQVKASEYIDYSISGHADYPVVSPPAGYLLELNAQPINPATGEALGEGQDTGVQKLTVVVRYLEEQKVLMTGYKVDR